MSRSVISERISSFCRLRFRGERGGRARAEGERVRRATACGGRPRAEGDCVRTPRKKRRSPAFYSVLRLFRAATLGTSGWKSLVNCEANISFREKQLLHINTRPTALSCFHKPKLVMFVSACAHTHTHTIFMDVKQEVMATVLS